MSMRNIFYHFILVDYFYSASSYEDHYFGFRRDCTIYEAKTKALISCIVTMQLICTFVFPYAKSRFSHDATLSVFLTDLPLFLDMFILDGSLTCTTHFLSDFGLREVGLEAKPDCDWLTYHCFWTCSFLMVS